MQTIGKIGIYQPGKCTTNLGVHIFWVTFASVRKSRKFQSTLRRTYCWWFKKKIRRLHQLIRLVGSWNPIIYQVLALSQLVGLGISEPSTVSHCEHPKRLVTSRFGLQVCEGLPSVERIQILGASRTPFFRIHHENQQPSFLGVITHILGCKTFIFHGFGVQGQTIWMKRKSGINYWWKPPMNP